MLISIYCTTSCNSYDVQVPLPALPVRSSMPMPGDSGKERVMLEARIADAEEKLRQSIAQRIERNRSELSRLQREQE